MRTEPQLCEALQSVNTAIQALINGDRLRSLTVGSGEFQRRYSFAEITLDNLYQHKDELQKELDTLLAKKSGSDLTQSTRYQIGWTKGF